MRLNRSSGKRIGGTLKSSTANASTGEGRRSVAAAAFLCVVSVNARGYGEDFGLPFVQGESVQGEIAGVPVVFGWNKATSPPTIYSIEPVDLAVRPVVLARTDTPDEVAASEAEFIDAHPEWFRVSSKNLDFRPFKWAETGWIVRTSQFHRGVHVSGGNVDLTVGAGGRLYLLTARLFPEADLEGLSTETAVSGERAIVIALASFDYSEHAWTWGLEKVVSFRGTTPFMAWGLNVTDSDLSIYWGYFIDAQTGEILWSGDTGTYEQEVDFVRGDANGDGKFDIADPTAIFSALFLGKTELYCSDAADVNDDGSLDITDGVYDLNYLFLGGPPPAKPFPSPGPDATPDSFVCLLEHEF